MMRKNISACAIMMAIVCAFASCGSTDSDDTTSVTISSDAAITAFTLGTLKTYTTLMGPDGVTPVKKKTDPTQDSIVTTTYSGSDFTINIDQANHLICPADSLPLGTKMKMLATVTSMNSATMYYQKSGASTWTDYSSSDSIDFSEPLKFRVISTDASYTQNYDVNIYAHQADPDLFHWTKLSEHNAIFENSTVFKGRATTKIVGGKEVTDCIYVLTSDGVYLTETHGDTWEVLNPSAKGQSMVINDNGVYVLANDGNNIYVNSITTPVPTSVQLQTLVAGYGKRLYAISVDKKFYESTDGMTWVLNDLDANFEDREAVPYTDASYTIHESNNNPDMLTITVIGNKAAMTSAVSDTCAVVWSKTVKEDGTTIANWAQVRGQQDVFRLPRLKNLSSCGYADCWMMAIGGTPVTGVQSATAYDKIFASYRRDFGLIWTKKDGLGLPTGTTYDPEKPVLLASDFDGYVYVINAADGSVWRGGMNAIIWEKIKK